MIFRVRTCVSMQFLLFDYYMEMIFLPIFTKYFSLETSTRLQELKGIEKNCEPQQQSW